MGLWTNLVDLVKAAGRGTPRAVTLFPDQGVGRDLLGRMYPGAVGEPPAQGVSQQLDAYTTMPWLRAVAEKVAQSVAAVEWQLFVPMAKARERGRERRAYRDKALQRAGHDARQKAIRDRRDADDLEQIEDHPFLDAIDRPNTFHTGVMLRKLTQTHLDLVGESFWLKDRNGVGAPAGFWPLPPHWVLSTPTPDRPVYRISTKGFQGEVPATEIVWFNNPQPGQPYGRGTGIGQALGAELETDDYASKLTRAMFWNQARPDFLIWPKGDVSLRDAEVRRLENEWVNRHGGYQRAARPGFLSGEVGIHEFQKNLRDLQFTELRAFERDTIIQVFGGVPPELLGVLETSNRATIDSASYLFAQYVIVPRLELLRSILQERLIPEYDDRLVLDYLSPVKEDLEQQNNILRTYAWAFTVDEIRARAGEVPLENKADGNAHAVWMNMVFQRSLVGPTAAEPGAPPAEVPSPEEVGLPSAGQAGNVGVHDPSANMPDTPGKPRTSPNLEKPEIRD